MKCEIEEFIDYLHNTRGTSKNTEVSYERDLRKLETYLTEGGFETEEQVTSTVLNSYVLYMERKKFCGFFYFQKHCVRPCFFSVSDPEIRMEGKPGRRS